MKRQPYPTDLRDGEWVLIEPLLPAAKPNVRPRKYALREIVNAIRYLVRSGCAWRLLPHDFPPYRSVFYYFKQWQRDGTWQRVHEQLRQQVRVELGRNASASAASLDSQSVATTEKGA